MQAKLEQVSGLLVKDVMNKHVITVSESDEMRSAAERLFAADVTGVPVVDAAGKCVGMLSSRDFVARDAGKNDLQILTRTSPDAPYTIECLDDCLVQTHMSPLVAVVSEDSPLVEAGRIMCAERIHRLVVVDTKQRPTGIVSAFDFVAAFVALAE